MPNIPVLMRRHFSVPSSSVDYCCRKVRVEVVRLTTVGKTVVYGKGGKQYYAASVAETDQWVIAVKLERYYTKEEILTMYLNNSTS